MDKETETVPAIGTLQDTKPASALSDKKSFGRDVGKLVSGTVIAQAVGICLMPIITRIFGPDILGSATVLISIVSVLTVVSCLLYERAILLPKEDNDAGAVLLSSLIVLFLSSAVIAVVFLLFGNVILAHLHQESLKPYILIVPLLTFIDGLYLCFRYWNTRRKRFGTQAVTQALQSISGSVTKLGFGVGGLVNPGSILFGQLVGQLIGTLVLGVQIVRSDLQVIRSSISLSNMKCQMKRYKKFPLIYTWSELLNSVSVSLPAFLLSVFFSSRFVGFYSLGHQILSLPLSFIGSSIGQVFFQRAAVAKHDGTLPSLVEDVVSMLMSISFVPFAVLMVTGGTLFSVVFGAEWYEAGVFSQILALWMLIVFFTNPISTLVSVLEIQEFGLKMNIIICILRFATLTIGGISGNIYLALVLFMLSGVFFNGFYNYYVVRKSGGMFRNIWMKVRKYLGIGICIIACLVCLQFLPIPDIVLFILCCLIVTVYEGVLFLKNPDIRSYIL